MLEPKLDSQSCGPWLGTQPQTWVCIAMSIREGEEEKGDWS